MEGTEEGGEGKRERERESMNVYEGRRYAGNMDSERITRVRLWMNQQEWDVIVERREEMLGSSESEVEA